MDAAFIMCPQNSFLASSGSVYMGERAEVLKIRLVDWLKDCGIKKVFFRMSRAMQDDFFRGEITHSIATTNDFQICPELTKYTETIFNIYRYNAFYMTMLDGYIKREKIQSVALLGLETCTTILFTAEELRNRGVEVDLVEPCCMSRDESLHGASIELLRKMGVGVTS